MIGLDTNILVRFYMQDEPAQAKKVNRLFASLTPENPGYVSLIVLLELHWVLKKIYKFDRASLADAALSLLSTAQIKVESASIVLSAIKNYKTISVDFEDALIAKLALNAGCESIYTFDKTAAKYADMTLLT
jgi:predicted nucleic-acid-binding protein